MRAYVKKWSKAFYKFKNANTLTKAMMRLMENEKF